MVPSDQVYSTSSPVTVTIDNIPATVYGAALAPSFVGEYQVAIQVPASSNQWKLAGGSNHRRFRWFWRCVVADRRGDCSSQLEQFPNFCR